MEGMHWVFSERHLPLVREKERHQARLSCGLIFSGTHRGPGVGTAHRAHLGIMAGLQVPDVPFIPHSL